MFFPDVKMLKIVMDNLNTHIYTAILKNFEFKEALELINKVNFYYTPKHASYLNIAEIEINVMDTQCTGIIIIIIIIDKNLLINETTAFINNRNKNNAKINWNFTKKDADKKLSKYYLD
jgi:hypothetical protein